MSLAQDIFYALRVAYVALLKNNITQGGIIPIYNGSVPPGVSVNKYILIENIGSFSVSPKNAKVTDTTIQITIFCKGADLTGNEHEDIGAQVLNIVDPNRRFKVLDNQYFSVTQQEVVSDSFTPRFAVDTTDLTLERQIRIDHRVVHKGKG